MNKITSLFVVLVCLASFAYAQTPQLTHGMQEIIIQVYDPDQGGYSSGVDYILWGLAPDTYGPPMPVLLPSCTASNMCNISVMWDTTKTPNGLATVYARAWDKRGNESLEASKSFNVQNDNAPPVVTITAPLAGATVQGQVQIAAYAADDVSGIASMELWINGRQRAFTTENASLNYRWNSNPERRNYPTSTIQVRSKDRVGNESFKTIQVTLR